MNRVHEVNRALKARGAAEKLTAGRGYYYFRDGDASSWPSTSVYVCYSDDYTVAEWLREYDVLRNAAVAIGRVRPLPVLTGVMRDALRSYANEYGRGWKRELCDDWTNGRCVGPLQQVRNVFGPSWLVKHGDEAIESGGGK